MIDQFREWKRLSFLQIAEQLDKDLVTNIVIVGDSQIEMDAGLQFSKYNRIFSLLNRVFKKSCLKAVKLKDGPTLSELTK